MIESEFYKRVKYPENRPDEYGKYLVWRKDGKFHLETWNNTGWAYNDKVIEYWLKEVDIETVKEHLWQHLLQTDLSDIKKFNEVIEKVLSL